jgi:hypothetical protein
MAVFSFCVVVMCTSLLRVLTGSREVHMTTTQIENTATCPDKVLTKTTRRRVALQQEQPLKMVKGIDRNMYGGTTDTDILMF